jgi:hypothetical protein
LVVRKGCHVPGYDLFVNMPFPSTCFEIPK